MAMINYILFAHTGPVPMIANIIKHTWYLPGTEDAVMT